MAGTAMRAAVASRARGPRRNRTALYPGDGEEGVGAAGHAPRTDVGGDDQHDGHRPQDRGGVACGHEAPSAWGGDEVPHGGDVPVRRQGAEHVLEAHGDLDVGQRVPAQIDEALVLLRRPPEDSLEGRPDRVRRLRPARRSGVLGGRQPAQGRVVDLAARQAGEPLDVDHGEVRPREPGPAAEEVLCHRHLLRLLHADDEAVVVPGARAR